MLSKQEIELLIQHASGLINKIKFEEKFDRKIDYFELNEILDNYLGDNQMFNACFWYLPTNLDKRQNDKLIKKYIVVKNLHTEHEEMLNHFHSNTYDFEDNLMIIKDLINDPPLYFLKDGREEVLLVKCLFTINKHIKDFTLRYFDDLLDSNNNMVAEKSNSYLKLLFK